jgi:hypothetical protein
MYCQILAGDLAFLPLSAYVYDPTYIGPQYKKVHMSIHRTLPVRKGKTQGVKIWAWQTEKQYKYIIKISKQY